MPSARLRTIRLLPTSGVAGLLLAAAVAVVPAFGLLTASADAQPRPSAVPSRWELRFEPGPLRLHVDPVDGQTYLFFTYTITNLTGRDQVWAPTLVLFTDRGEIAESGKDVPSRVEERLRELLGNPLLETRNEIIGDIRQGREHARDGLAVWKVDDIRMNEVSLFVSGISGETARIQDPLTGEDIILRKTLQRDYLAPGDLLARGDEPIPFVRERWVMR